MGAHIPKMLKTAAPARPGVGCVDGACEADTVDLSTDALLREGLKGPTPDVNDANFTATNEPDPKNMPAIDPEIRGQMLFRTALNVIFGIFPALSGSGNKALRPNSLRQKRKSLGDRRGSSNSVNVAFSAKTKSSRHSLYQEYSLKASAWIANALHKLNAGRSHVKN